MEKTSKIKGLIYGILSSSTFGLIPLFAVPAMNAGIGINSVILYRFGISAFFMFLWMLLGRQNLKINMKELVTIIFLGGLLRDDRLHADFVLPIHPEWHCDHNPFPLSGCRDGHHGPLLQG